MIPRLHPIAAALLGAALLPGCVSPTPRMQLTVKPIEEVRNSPGARLDHYDLGRYYQSTGKTGLAIEAYTQALKVNGRHVEARNALATLYSQQGRLAEAETLMREVVAESPQAAYLHNNLGYIRYLQGDHVAAIREFRAALALDPQHQWARNNLALAEAGLSRSMEASFEPTARRAETTAKAFEVWGEVKGHQGKLERNFEAALSILPPPPVSQAAALSARVATPPPATDVVAQALIKKPAPTLPVEIVKPLARAMGQLPSKPGHVMEAEVRSTVATSMQKYRVEVSNGNGVEGSARRVSIVLAKRGIAVANLTNQMPYDQATTEIQYRQGFEQEAQRILDTLRNNGVVKQVDRQRYRTDLRIVLGRDLSAQMAELEADKATVAAADRPPIVASARSIAGPL